MQLDPQGLYVVGPVGSTGKVAEVELDLVPPLVQTHRHCADKGLDSGGALVVRSPETTSNVFVVEDLHLEREVLFQVFYDHHQKWKLYAQSLRG